MLPAGTACRIESSRACSRDIRKGGVELAPAFDLAAFERATDSLLDILSVEIAQALVAYRGDDKLRAKIDELAGKNTEGLLTDKDA